MTTDSSTGDWTPERIEEARERCAAATPGPWEIDHEGLVRTASPEMLDEPIVLASTYPGEEGRLQWSTEDRAFISHAREDLPAALAEIERLTAELANIHNAARAVEAQRSTGPGWSRSLDFRDSLDALAALLPKASPVSPKHGGPEL